MTIQEMMERTGAESTNLAIAWIKDAIHLIQSHHNDNIGTWKTNITKGVRDYPFPANLIKLKIIGVFDTNDKKYKRIRRLGQQPMLLEDRDPPT